MYFVFRAINILLLQLLLLQCEAFAQELLSLKQDDFYLIDLVTGKEQETGVSLFRNRNILQRPGTSDVYVNDYAGNRIIQTTKRLDNAVYVLDLDRHGVVRPQDFDIDFETNTIFYVDGIDDLVGDPIRNENYEVVNRQNLFGGNHQRLFDQGESPSLRILGVAYDPQAEMVYFTLGATHRSFELKRVPASGGEVETLREFDGETETVEGDIGCVRVAKTLGKIFWTEEIDGVGYFIRANPDPFEIEKMVTPAELSYRAESTFGPFALDEENGIIYINVELFGFSDIGSINFDLEPITRIISEFGGTAIGLINDPTPPDPDKKTVYRDTIPAAPEVSINGNIATVTLEEFDTASTALAPARTRKKKKGKVNIRYQVFLSNSADSNVKKKRSKQNVVTFADLASGVEYTVNYRILIRKGRRIARRTPMSEELKFTLP